MASIIQYPVKPKGNAAKDPTAYADALSFMRKLSRFASRHRLSSIDMWNVKPTGNNANDWALGKDLARELLAYVAASPTHGNLHLFHWIVADIHEKAVEEGRRLNAVELGFLKSVGTHAVAAAVAGLSD